MDKIQEMLTNERCSKQKNHLRKTSKIVNFYSNLDKLCASVKMLRLARRPWKACNFRCGPSALSTKSVPPNNRSDGQPEPGFFAAWKACKGEERRQLVVLSISGAALNLGFGVVIPALPVLSQELGFGATGVGLLLAAPSLARVIFNLPAGALVDSFGRVPCMIAGEMFAALGCLGTGFALSLNTMLPVRFMGGTGAALAAAGSAAYLADLTERPHLKLSESGLCMCFFSLVFVIMFLFELCILVKAHKCSSNFPIFDKASTATSQNGFC